MTGKNYKSMRYKNYMTQEFVANTIGISRFSLSAYESDMVDIPLSESIKLNKLYNIDEADIDRYMMI